MQLFSYIEEDMRQRIENGSELPAPLTLAGIAGHYEVSITPVRRAVQELVASGHLLKGGHHGRLEIGQRRRRLRKSAAELPEPTDWDALIMKHVLDLALAGKSVYLREEATARKFGIGRTVIRTVFGRLAGRGLLVHIPNRGWQVRSVEIEDAAAYLAVREALELKALELAWDNIDPAILQQMLAGNPEGTPGDALIDNSLHAYLIRASSNRFIADFFERHGTAFAVLFDHAATNVAVMDEMAAQHRQIIQAMVDGDLALAAEELRRHIRSQVPILQAALAKRQKKSAAKRQTESGRRKAEARSLVAKN